MIGTVVSVARFATGRDLVGPGVTDARWAHAGTQTAPGVTHASRWAHQPHRRRAGIRLAGVTAAVLLVYGSLTDWWSTATTLRLAFWLGLALAAWVAVHKTRRWSHHQQWVVPTAIALADRLGISRHVEPVAWVHVPADHRDDPDKTTTIDLPKDYNASQAQQKALIALAASKLGLRSPDAGIDMQGERPVMWLRAAPIPPERVPYARVREQLEAADEGAPFLGLASRMTEVHVSWALDSPHLLASFGSGGGKSALGRLLAAQALHKGTRVIVVDSVKRGASHKWARGVPGVEIHRNPATAHDALVALAERVSDRCEIAYNGGPLDFPRVLLIVEESNATINQLNRYWREELQGQRTSPAVLALADILCVGREAKVHTVAVGQQMTAQASGGGAARENYGVKLLSRFSRNTAKMLAPELAPTFPRSSTHPGRAQMIVAGEATEVQIAFLTDAEAVEWATSGAPVTQLDGPSALGGSTVHDTAGSGGRVVALRTSLVTLTAAAAQLGVDATALRNGRARDADFPPARDERGRSKLYDLDELRRWAANRPQAGAS